MTAILTWLGASPLGQLLLNFLWAKLAALAASLFGAFIAGIKTAERRHKIEQDAKKSVQPLKDAKTGQEVDDATDDALNGL